MEKKFTLLKAITGIMVMLAGTLLFSSCEKYTFQVETVDPDEPILFQTQIQPIFTANCITCHRGSRNPDLREGNSYKSLSEGGYVSLPADGSKLYKMVTSASHSAFTLDAEKQMILNWINQGFQDN